MKKEPILKVQNLSKIFYSKNNSVKAINNVSFELNKGEIIGLIGESGSGKTTVGRTIIKLHEASSGVISLNGKDISSGKLNKEENRSLRTNIQMIFQDPYSSLNNQKNIMNIVSEPLKVNKQHLIKVDSFLDSRTEVLYYYQVFLARKYLNSLEKFEKERMATTLKGYEKVFEELKGITFSKNKNIFDNMKYVVDTFFNTKEMFNNMILVNLNKKLPFFFKQYKIALNKIETKIFDDDFERNIQITKDEIEKMDFKIDVGPKRNNHDLKARTNKIKKYRKNIKHTKEHHNNQIISSTTPAQFIYIKFLIFKADVEIKTLTKILKANIIIQIHDFIDIFEKWFSKTSKKLIELVKSNFRTQRSILLEQINNDTLSDEEIINRIHLEQMEMPPIPMVDFEKKLEIDKKIVNIDLFVDKLEKEYKFKNNDMGKNNEISTAKSEALIKKKQVLESKLRKLISENDKLIEKEKQSFIIEREEKRNAFIEKDKEFNLKIETLSLEANNLFKEKLLEAEKYSKFNLNKNKNLNFRVVKKNIKEIIRKNTEMNDNLSAEIKRNYKDFDIYEGLIEYRGSKLNKRKFKGLVLRNMVYEALYESGLDKSYAYRYPTEFSGGMRQRVGIARAIVINPSVIIADEPIAALDLSIQAKIVNMLMELKDKSDMSMIFIAHDLSMVRFNADRLLVMHNGSVVESGETEEVFNNPIHPYTKNLIKSIPSLDNMNKPFEDNIFALRYDKKYNFINEPKMIEISKKHYVLATQDQYNEWKK